MINRRSDLAFLAVARSFSASSRNLMMVKRTKNCLRMLRLTSPNPSRDLPSSPDFSSPPRPLLPRPRPCLRKRKPQPMSRMPPSRNQRSPRPLLRHLWKPSKRGPRRQTPPSLHPYLRRKPDEPLGPPTSWRQKPPRSSAPARRVPLTPGSEPRSTRTDQARNALLQSRWLRPPQRELAPRRCRTVFFLLQSVVFIPPIP